MTKSRFPFALGVFTTSAIFLLGAYSLADDPVGDAGKSTPGAAAQETAATQPPGDDNPEKTANDVRRWIQQLGSLDYATRKAAQEKLLMAGLDAYEALQQSAASTNLEVASQSRYLLGRMQVEIARPGDPAEAKALLKDYTKQNDKERASRIARLAAMTEQSVAPALCRVMRLEKSETNSKKAALAIITRPRPQTPAERDALRKSIIRGTGVSDREAATWLRGYANTLSQPEKAIVFWNEQIEREKKTNALFPGKKSDLTILATMYDLKIELLKELGRSEQATDAIISQLQYNSDPRGAVIKLTLQLIDQKKLDMADRLVGQFKEKYARDRDFLFLATEVACRLNKEEEAGKLLDQIKALPGNLRGTSYQAGNHFRARGLYDWAEREFRKAIEETGKKPAPVGPRLPINPGVPVEVYSGVNVLAYLGLAEMFFDGEDYDKGADTIQQCVDKINEKKKTPDGSPKIPLSTGTIDLKSRIAYFRGMGADKRKDYKASKQYMQQVLAADAEDTEVMIALFNNPELDDDERKKIKETVANFLKARKQLLDLTRVRTSRPESLPASDRSRIATLCNHYAWVIARTEGDIDDAITKSELSLKLLPDQSAFLDTLANCHYAKGNLDKAIEIQRKASEKAPNERVLQRNLKRFEKAAAEAKEQEKKDE